MKMKQQFGGQMPNCAILDSAATYQWWQINHDIQANEPFFRSSGEGLMVTSHLKISTSSTFDFRGTGLDFASQKNSWSDFEEMCFLLS